MYSAWELSKLPTIFSSGMLASKLYTRNANHPYCLSEMSARLSCFQNDLPYSNWRRLDSRRISICSPLFMGRRSCKIAPRKTAQDLKRSKLYGKISKEVISAVKREGPNPATNSMLATVLQRAKELNVPRDIVERNIRKASERGQEAYIEKVYEIYGFGGIGIIVEAMTDNLNRTTPLVKDVVKRCGAKIADPGSVQFKFKRVRVVNVNSSDVTKDKLLDVSLDADAEDVIEPTEFRDMDVASESERYFKVVTTTENYRNVTSKFKNEGIPYEPDNGFELLPITPIKVDSETMDLNQELISKLLQIDDVDAVYSDQKC